MLVSNVAPSLSVSSQTSASAEMRDGEGEITLLPQRSMFMFLEDSDSIAEVSITLGNFNHSEERISFYTNATLGSINVTSSGRTVLLSGPASPGAFDQLLTEGTILYHYPAMESILQGDRPEFTTR